MATSREGYWLNITDEGATYDGEIGNDGADYSYDYSDELFKNSSDGKNITFNEITLGRAIFLIGELDNNNAVLGGHSSEESFATDTGSIALIGNTADINFKSGEFWINDLVKNQADFKREVKTNAVYAVRAAGAGVKINQTQYKNSATGVWKGKFKKYIVFDSAISSNEAEGISEVLFRDLVDGKAFITGTISYENKEITIPTPSGGVSVSVDKSEIEPSGARSFAYTYTVESGTLPAGITLSSSTGAVTVGSSFTTQGREKYVIKAEINNNANYLGSVTGDLFLNTFETYVGATNISDIGANIVFSRIPDYDIYSFYTNLIPVKTIAAAEAGTSDAVVTSSEL